MPAVTLDEVSWDPIDSGSTSGWTISDELDDSTVQVIYYNVGNSLHVTWSGMSNGYWMTDDPTIGGTRQTAGSSNLFTISSTNNTIYHFWSVTTTSGTRTSPYRAKKVRFVQNAAAHPTSLSLATDTAASQTPQLTLTASGHSGSLQYAVTTTSTGPDSSGANIKIAWQTSNVITATQAADKGIYRGGWHNTTTPSPKDRYWYFWAKATGAGNNGKMLQATPPFLATDREINLSSTSITADPDDGSWSLSVSGNGSNENYSAATTGTYSSGDTITEVSGVSSTGVGGTSISGTLSSNGSATYYVWASRTKTSGGNGGQGWPDSSDTYVTGPGWEPAYLTGTTTVPSFTVTRGSSSNPAVTNATGVFFDTTAAGALDESDTDSKFLIRASFTGLDSTGNYAITRTVVENGVQTKYAKNQVGTTDPWFTTNGSSTITFEDTWTFAEKIAATQSYELWRNASSESLTGASKVANCDFTRTFTGPNYLLSTIDTTIATGASSYTIALTGLIPGISYWAYNGTANNSTALGGVAPASGVTTGSINITDAAGLPAAANGSTKTIYIWMSSPLNHYNGALPGTKSLTVTRSSHEYDLSTSTSNYGLKVKNYAGNVVFDSSTRTAQIVGVGSLLGSSGGFVASGDYTDDVSISGLTNDPVRWVIAITAVTRETTYANSPWFGLFTADYSIHLNNNGTFKIRNTLYSGSNATVGCKYSYLVIKTRGT